MEKLDVRMNSCLNPKRLIITDIYHSYKNVVLNIESLPSVMKDVYYGLTLLCSLIITVHKKRGLLSIMV